MGESRWTYCSVCHWSSKTSVDGHSTQCVGPLLVVNEEELDIILKNIKKNNQTFVGSVETRTTSSTGGQKGVKLARFDLIPVEPLYMLAEHFGAGARKYDEHQWRRGYEWSKSYSAIHRHLAAFWAGDDFDTCNPHKESRGECLTIMDGKIWVGPEDTCWNHTGSHHMTAVAWHSFVLLEFLDKHPEHDDRYRYKPARNT